MCGMLLSGVRRQCSATSLMMQNQTGQINRKALVHFASDDDLESFDPKAFVV
jgi:hypothetical protein